MDGSSVCLLLLLLPTMMIMVHVVLMYHSVLATETRSRPV